MTCVLIVLAVIALAALVFFCLYFNRIKTFGTIEKLSDYADGYNLYRMDVKYGYSTGNIIKSGIKDNQSFINAVIKECLPLLKVNIEVPAYGCTAFSMTDAEGKAHMGRNYDFKLDTSAMIVYCTPKNGYKSVGFAALNNISADKADANLKSKMAALTAPFICNDGINEKGVSIAVLTLPSKPTDQNTGKPKIATSLAIRLVLDNAATTEEAVELLRGYDMFAANGRDYHFYITDASGDGRVVEYDCESEGRETVVTPCKAVTNYFEMYTDKVVPFRKNGIYGAGKERRDKVLAALEEDKEHLTNETVWKALKSSSQAPNPEDITSNTQWSIAYNNTDLTAEAVIRRHWEDTYCYSLAENSVKLKK